MDTKLERAPKQAVGIESLLDSLIRGFEVLSPLAFRIFDAELLPSALERLVEGEGPEDAWCCWQDRRQLWFYMAQMSPTQSREQGGVVLHVNRLDWDGELIETGWWIRSERWRRLY